jgi:hypothetical protein
MLSTSKRYVPTTSPEAVEQLKLQYTQFVAAGNGRAGGAGYPPIAARTWVCITPTTWTPCAEYYLAMQLFYHTQHAGTPCVVDSFRDPQFLDLCLEPETSATRRDQFEWRRRAAKRPRRCRFESANDGSHLSSHYGAELA